jgi:hypothetical protein
MPFRIWSGVEEWSAEVAAVELSGDGLTAIGTQLGAEPAPFRVDYRLEAPDFVSRELELTATTRGWRRHLLLRHDGTGGWSAEVEDDGDVAGGTWDGSLPELSEARDVDIENSPLTNTMPILRADFMEGGAGEFTMAFIRMPTLRVEASKQGYKHLRRTESGSIVRYMSLDSDFTADLELNQEGLVELYPRLARRVTPGARVNPLP